MRTTACNVLHNVLEITITYLYFSILSRNSHKFCTYYDWFFLRTNTNPKYLTQIRNQKRLGLMERSWSYFFWNTDSSAQLYSHLLKLSSGLTLSNLSACTNVLSLVPFNPSTEDCTIKTNTSVKKMQLWCECHWRRNVYSSNTVTFSHRWGTCGKLLLSWR